MQSAWTFFVNILANATWFTYDSSLCIVFEFVPVAMFDKLISHPLYSFLGI
jgi:hypothetical protein